jgi:hypothetical protein
MEQSHKAHWQKNNADFNLLEKSKKQFYDAARGIRGSS